MAGAGGDAPEGEGASLKPVPNDRTVCLRHAQTFPRGESCPACEIERERGIKCAKCVREILEIERKAARYSENPTWGNVRRRDHWARRYNAVVSRPAEHVHTKAAR